MDLTFASAPVRSKAGLVLMVVTVTVVLVVGAIVALVGTRPPAVPAAFGPAVNGALYYVSDGEVLRLDPERGVTTTVIPDVGADTSVLPSRDGTRLAVITKSGWSQKIAVVDADGRDLRQLPHAYGGEFEIEWSPSGDALAVASDGSGLGRITVVPVDGSEPKTLELGMDARHIGYLPDGRLLYKGTTETPAGQRFALYLIDPTSGVPEAVTDESSFEMDIIAARPSPDGRIIVYHRWREPGEQGRIRVIDVASRTDVALPVDDPDGVFTDLNPGVSPDGGQILFTRYTMAGNQLVVLPATGGTPTPIGEYTPSFDAPEASWSPDGDWVIARYHNGNVWLLDVTGAGRDRRFDISSPGLPAWQRVGG